MHYFLLNMETFKFNHFPLLILVVLFLTLSSGNSSSSSYFLVLYLNLYISTIVVVDDDDDRYNNIRGNSKLWEAFDPNYKLLKVGMCSSLC